MTHELDEINDFINRHFCKEFLEQDLSRFNNQEDAEANFDTEFEHRYNTDEGCNIDLWPIRRECDFLTTMKICEFVASKMDELGLNLTEAVFKDHDKLLRKYIYFHLRKNYYPYMITTFIPAYPYEEEPEPELPPAQ